jgi:hypothetical protein
MSPSAEPSVTDRAFPDAPARSLRRWILGVAVLCLVAGVALGLAFARWSAPPPADLYLLSVRAKWTPWAERFSREFGLDRVHTAILWQILVDHEHELERLRSFDVIDSPSGRERGGSQDRGRQESRPGAAAAGVGAPVSLRAVLQPQWNALGRTLENQILKLLASMDRGKLDRYLVERQGVAP